MGGIKNAKKKDLMGGEGVMLEGRGFKMKCGWMMGGVLGGGGIKSASPETHGRRGGREGRIQTIREEA